MKPELYAALLKDLQKLEKRLVPAYLDVARTDPEQLARLTQRHREAEVGGRLDDYLQLCARRSAVQLLLRTVYVRVLEDLGALDPPRIRGARGLAVFKEVAPALGVRGHLRWTFRDLARDFPALFTPGPDELPLPVEDLCDEVWLLWHRERGPGKVVYGWRPEDDGNGGGFDSRFLGDLYQDLDAEVRKRFALLQTPRFVEEYILDHTLTPALAEFDPAGLAARGETFRLLDPTCGSGHFLIGAFHRLAAWWEGRGLEKWDAARRALESVWGCDINPHAVDIARFRLLLEVRERTGVTELERLAGLPLNLAVMDSLVPWERGERQGTLFPGEDRLSSYATAEERAANAAFLKRALHVVVGNPPYITPKDERKREDYRAFWPDSCHRSYALSAPFIERLFVLGLSGAFIGQITANSFMKREFGKNVVTVVLPRWDLTEVIDTSGAFIPGHGTPTAILFGRAQEPVSRQVRALLGKRGEPRRPERPEEGLVWSAIAEAGDGDDDSNAFVTVARTERAVFCRHPWSLGGGGRSELRLTIHGASEGLLQERASEIGFGAVTREDDLYLLGRALLNRLGIDPKHQRYLVPGELVRDYSIGDDCMALCPYEPGTLKAETADRIKHAVKFLWPHKRVLSERVAYGKTQIQRGLHWYEYSMLFAGRFKTPLTISFAFVATHNHFILDRSRKFFIRTAPIIKLPLTATLDDHLDLLGLLNSSTLGFWMRQVFHDKGNRGTGGGITAEDWERFHEYDSTKLQQAPLTTKDRAARVALARALDATAQERAACLPLALLAGDWTAADLPMKLATARDRYRGLTHRMVALQEELDWLTYHSYGLIDEIETVGPDDAEPLAPGHRPFEILAARADEEADPDEKSAWWTRHGHDKVTEIPERYAAATRGRLQDRMDRIEADPRLQLLESFPHKRRWQTPDLLAEAKKAAESWLLDRLEDLFAPARDDRPAGPLARPRPYRLEEIVTSWSRDERVAAAAGVFTGSRDVDLTLVAERLLQSHALPDNPYRLYSAEGLRKLDAWKAVWALQDREDAGERIEIPLPPQWKKEDFLKADFFSVRGKLNVPRERFVRFGELTPPGYGWNGWRDLERAMAQVEAYTLAEGDPTDPLPAPTALDPRRCGATLGLWESLPDVKRWGPAAEHGELLALAQEVCQQPCCPCALVERWQAWQQGALVVASHAQPAEVPSMVSVGDRAKVIGLIEQATGQTSWLGDLAAPFVALKERWSGPAARLEQVLDDLVASGDLAVKGKGLKRTYEVARRAEQPGPAR